MLLPFPSPHRVIIASKHRLVPKLKGYGCSVVVRVAVEAKPDIGAHLAQLGNVALYSALGNAQALGQLGG